MMKVIALVVGIDNYSHPEFFKPLKCAVSDAKAVAEVFSRLKIEVIESYDECDDEVRTRLDEFTNKIQDDMPDVAVFYFAGHGERPNLQDCLVLKDALRNPNGETVLLGHCLAVNNVMQQMNGAGNQMNILILDACRNETRGTILKQETSFKVPFQTFIAYSTTAGCTASDGLAGGHSPFTGALLNHIMTENLKIEELFKQTRKDMLASGHKQYSWDYSCLVNDFCFNHGQLSRHYGSTYSFLTFSRVKYTLKDVICKDFVIGIQSENENKIDRAMRNLVSQKNVLKPEDMFKLGRCMLHASNNVFVAKFINTTKLSLLNIHKRNPFFDGLLYEMFFDEEDKCRGKNIAGIGILDAIARICDSPDFASSLAFIQKELESFKDQVSFVPGNDIHTVRLVLEQSEIFENKNKKVWVIKGVDYKGDNLYETLEQTAYTYQNLRMQIRDNLRIPFRNLGIKVNENIKKNDILIVEELGYVDSFIDEYYNIHIPDEFDELGHHYEFCGVDDCVIDEVEEEEGLLVVSGTFTISVVVYYDDEEEVNNDFSLDGVYRMTLSYGGNKWSVENYEEIKLDTPSC